MPTESQDYFPTEEEESLLVTNGLDVHWWVIRLDGTYPEDLLRERPLNSNIDDGSGFTPWYNLRPHLHGPHHDWPWSIHARGTRESVRALQLQMLRRLN
jgi:hypothetical protein